jgi:hypothetical protein
MAIDVNVGKSKQSRATDVSSGGTRCVLGKDAEAELMRTRPIGTYFVDECVRQTRRPLVIARQVVSKVLPNLVLRPKLSGTKAPEKTLSPCMILAE